MKLQPTFSWQKYEGKPEDQKNQFQYQLQNQHVQVSNSVNATIDDSSYWTRERQTGFTWIDDKPIWTKTIPTSTWAAVGTVNTIPLGITGDFYLIQFFCFISNGSLSTSNTLFIPHNDVAVAINNISIARLATNIVITTGGVDMSAYSGYVTIYYTKV